MRRMPGDGGRRDEICMRRRPSTRIYRLSGFKDRREAYSDEIARCSPLNPLSIPIMAKVADVASTNIT